MAGNKIVQLGAAHVSTSITPRDNKLNYADIRNKFATPVPDQLHFDSVYVPNCTNKSVMFQNQQQAVDQGVSSSQHIKQIRGPSKQEAYMHIESISNNNANGNAYQQTALSSILS